MDDVDVLPEPELPAAARRGDPAAFEELVDSHRRELYAHCYRMLGSVQDAEDGLQESLLAAWRGLSGFEGRSSLGTWLYRISTNACLRLAARRPRRILSPDHGPPRSDTADTLTDSRTKPWHDTTRIVRRVDAHQQIAELKKGPGRDILVFGSRTLWNDLLAAGLVDELHLMIGPVVVGGGTPAFGAGPVPPLRLLSTHTWDGTDNMLVRYAPGDRAS
ncbi:sigma-70 family RNA polymerase sigma factor [Streptomyces sp. V1I1]|uniref:sigma-70 family RNA polymerase sigma factor n=1 Tax=Streptomyces sp. V1I1 TaxID=3042272 RepID=UPI0027D829A2|nr:sigma-70 family RNA polymerase sigma factor [Streptomyces sp. V1I1]